MPTITADDTAPADPVGDALNAYRQIALWMHSQARELEKIENLPPLYAALAACLIKLSGLRPHRIFGEAGPRDASDLRTDLEAITLAIDPVIEAYGREARANFHGIEIEHFESVLRDSLEGFAFYDLEEAARIKRQEIREARGQQMERV